MLAENSTKAERTLGAKFCRQGIKEEILSLELMLHQSALKVATNRTPLMNDDQILGEPFSSILTGIIVLAALSPIIVLLVWLLVGKFKQLMKLQKQGDPSDGN